MISLFKYSKMCCVVIWKFSDVSDDRGVFIVRIKQSEASSGI
jgi:hypothetical protein